MHTLALDLGHDDVFVYVEEHADKLVAELQEIYDWARENNYEWVRINADGEIIDCLPLHKPGD